MRAPTSSHLTLASAGPSADTPHRLRHRGTVHLYVVLALAFLCGCGKQDGALPTAKTATEAADAPRPARETAGEGESRRRRKAPAGTVAERLVGRWTPDDSKLRSQTFRGVAEHDWLEARAMLRDLSFEFSDGAVEVQLGGRARTGTWALAAEGKTQALELQLSGGAKERFEMAFDGSGDGLTLKTERWPELHLRRVRQRLD